MLIELKPSQNICAYVLTNKSKWSNCISIELLRRFISFHRLSHSVAHSRSRSFFLSLFLSLLFSSSFCLKYKQSYSDDVEASSLIIQNKMTIASNRLFVCRFRLLCHKTVDCKIILSDWILCTKIDLKFIVPFTISFLLIDVYTLNFIILAMNERWMYGLFFFLSWLRIECINII